MRGPTLNASSDSPAVEIDSERWLLLAFGGTVFLGSFLLFLLEPIVAKELLPWFGGASNVWATCLVFFQVTLLLGYAYADTLARRVAFASHWKLHGSLLLLGALTLPIIPAAHWKPQGAGHPALEVLGALATTVGVPFVLMSAASPLIQSWFARRFPARSPYRLFALSNLASMLALLAYPALLEPWIGTRSQALLWSAGYVLWAALILACARAMRGAPREAIVATAPIATVAAEPSAAPTRLQYLTWVGLSALGAFLLIAVTNHMTRDIAAMPLLWVVPLAIYLATFIVSFQFSGRLNGVQLNLLAAAAIALYAGSTLYTAWPGEEDRTLPIWAQIGVSCLLLAGACLACHGRLALSRPSSAYLTRFYLAISVGGALGAIAIGIAAPALLKVDFDLQIALLATSAMLLAYTRWRPRPLSVFAGLCVIAGLAASGLFVHNFYEATIFTQRNFYGALRVYEWDADEAGRGRSLTNGIILHGTQFSAPDARRRPTEYYGEGSGVGRALLALRRDGLPHRIGVIGLGTGTLAAYGRPGDLIRFYDINPAVVGVSDREFTYLHDSAARIEIALGDARLSLERENPQRFDLLAVDAFSSDAIPVHLLTREALGVYLRHMRPGGVIAFHTSNRYVNLPPVIERLARERHLIARIVDDDDSDRFNTPNSWVLVSASALIFATPELASSAQALPATASRPWTDDFSDLLAFLR